MPDLPDQFRLALVLGGARSGKSRYGLSLAGQLPAPRLFIATCEPRDAEMEARIEQHQRERGSDWRTLEEPLDLAGVIAGAQGKGGVILVDCLTMWLSNLLAAPPRPEGAIQSAGENLLGVLQISSTPIILISNEVGAGIVPDNLLAREFRDWAGWLHQRLAAAADLVALVVAGIPMRLKPQ